MASQTRAGRGDLVGGAWRSDYAAPPPSRLPARKCLGGRGAMRPPVNLSFSACGFLGIYHLGAASAFRAHGRPLLRAVQAFAGASAGSLVASVLLTAPEKLEESKQLTFALAEEVRGQALGALTPGYHITARLRSALESVLPPDAHELAQRRLHVSLTNTRSGRNRLVSTFSSREELVEVLLASSFVPGYTGLRPLEYRGQTWVDGGFTDSLPTLPAGRTVTVSPFSGRPDICPRDEGQLGFRVSVANQEVMLSPANLARLNRAFFPPGRRALELLCQRGFEDAVRFLRREGWLQEQGRAAPAGWTSRG